MTMANDPVYNEIKVDQPVNVNPYTEAITTVSVQNVETIINPSITGKYFKLDPGGDLTIGDYTGGQGIFWDQSAGTLDIQGGLTVDELHIPDETTANSFHVETDGDSWWGATTADFVSDPDNANAYVLKTGGAKFQDITLEGAVILKDLQAGSVVAGTYIDALAVGKLSAGTIDSVSIVLGSSTSDAEIRSGIATGDFTNSGAASGFLIGADFSDSSKGKFYFGDGSSFIKWDGSTLTLAGSVNDIGKFGGDGSDGALTETSGTTTLNALGARFLILNYTSISLTGTADLTISNPHADGTTLILRSQGAVTITSSTNPAVDLQAMGGTGGSGGSGVLNNSSQSTRGSGVGGGFGSFTPSGVENPGAGGGGGGSDSRGVSASKTITSAGGEGGDPVVEPFPGANYVNAGGGGGGGGGGTNGSSAGGAGGAGGRGGGSIVIECVGALNISSVFNSAGAAGSAGTTTEHSNGGGGGGGGGGNVLIHYGTLTANTATFTLTAGSGGAAGSHGSGGTATAGGAGSAGSSLVEANTYFSA